MHFLKKAWRWTRTHKKIVIPAIVILIVLGIILKPKTPPPIATAKIDFHTITQAVSVSGAIAAKRTINLTFPIGGKISWIGVKKGSKVSAYQTIATLDQATAEKNLKAALISYSLQRNTFDQNIVNNNNIGDPVNALNDNMKRILQNNQYNLDQAVNSVELQDLARQQSILTTPIAGIVTRADVEIAGGTVIAGTTFTVTDPSSLVFSMDVDEAEVSKIQPGQKVDVVLDAYSNKTLTLTIASIDFVSHTTSNGGNAYTVEAQVPEDGNMYRVGMNGDGEIVIQQKFHALTVPLSALDVDNNVYIKTGKKYKKIKVTLGLQSDTDAEVLSGLHEGDVVALDPSTVTASKLVATK